MDSSYSDYEYHRFFTCDLIKEEFIATETDNIIDFHFCMHVEFSNWILRQDSSEPEFVRLYYEPVVVNHVVSMSRKEFSDSPRSRRFVEEELIRFFAVEEDDDSLMELVDFAFLEASRSATSDNHAANGVLNLHFNALTEHRYVVDVEVIDDCSFRMVPAAHSSIEGLLKKVAAVDSCRDTCCSICLEDLSGGGDGGSGDHGEEVVVLLSMPCSHVFHDDCIGTWLKTSHYCPLCRFEMPTEL